MALLEYKKSTQEGPSLYVFDEPDTHLHVKAQVDLLNIIRQFNENGKQIIITTHSPFIINAVKPKQIRMLTLKDRKTIVKTLSPEDKMVEKTLKNLGIENIYIFFARKILIVEGETEEVFVSHIYEKLFGTTLSSNLIKIIQAENITDVPRLARVIRDFINPEDIFILMDNDGDELTISILQDLQIPKENKFIVGNKEFEDAFDAEVIYKAWKSFLENNGRRVGTNWTLQNIREMKEKVLREGGKFSKKLRQLNTNSGLPMKKPLLAQALAEYCEKDHIPEPLYQLLEKLH